MPFGTLYYSGVIAGVAVCILSLGFLSTFLTSYYRPPTRLIMPDAAAGCSWCGNKPRRLIKSARHARYQSPAITKSE